MKTLPILVLATIITMLGCEIQYSEHTFGDTSKERVTAMTDLIKKRISPPGPILDAECIEEQTGDGRVGPSDFYFFAKIVVEKSDFASWKSVAGKRLSSWDYRSPRTELSWWPTQTEADDLEMYSSKPMFGRSNGWVGFAADGQTIYVLTYTM
ncbi:MAG: hypothetical protein GY768_17935 [Planctomycetaceae bacterium]|nr:hypothetical protein [Planctomycetaceae bacterium]